MNLAQIHTAFTEVVNRPGIYHLLDVPKNTVAQYRWKLKRDRPISLDKKVKVLQRAGYRMDVFEYTDKDMVDLLRFAMRNGMAAKEMGAEYLFEKWKRQPDKKRLKY